MDDGSGYRCLSSLEVVLIPAHDKLQSPKPAQQSASVNSLNQQQEPWKKRAHTILANVPASITIYLPRAGYQERPGQQSNYAQSCDHFTTNPGFEKITPGKGIQRGCQCVQKAMKTSKVGEAQPQLAL